MTTYTFSQRFLIVVAGVILATAGGEYAWGQEVQDATATSVVSQATGTPILDAVVSPAEERVSAPEVSGYTEATEEGLRLNFRGVPLDVVLEYLSKEVGFVIIREVEVEGTVDVMSYQPLDESEIVDLLNAILNRKGYAAIRTGRMLTIVSREEASKRDIPVRSGSDPNLIPKSDEMITQIIPIRYANATALVSNLESLIPTYAKLTANDSGNALVLTDTQTNVRRIIEIVRALDTSIANISAVKVFALQYADAKEIAAVVNELFKSDASSGGSNDPRRNMERMFSRMRGERGDDEGSSGETGAALKMASRVVAVADEHTNSVVVSAPEDLMPTITSLIDEIDTMGDTVTGVKVFRLKYADATEMAQLVTNVFKPDSANNGRQGSRRFMRGGGGFFGPPGMDQSGQPTSQRKTQESTVVAVADTRTNSVIVTAARDTLEQIGEMVKELDSDPAKGKKVFVYELENADPEGVATILRGMFQTTGTSTGSTTGNRNTGNTGRSRTSNQNTNTGTGSGSGAMGNSSTRGGGNSGQTRGGN